MRSRTANWFVCKIRFEKTMEDGMQKKVTEQYVVDALSFTEAETRIIKEMACYISGEYEVVDISRAPFGEVFFTDDAADVADKWYKSKLQFITIDEKTAKEKRSSVTYLVQAASLESARKNIDEVMGKTMIDYVTVGVNETSIMDVFEYTAIKAADLLEKMCGDLQDQSLTVEAIVDRYVSTATPELRQQLIGKLTEKRKEMFGVE